MSFISALLILLLHAVSSSYFSALPASNRQCTDISAIVTTSCGSQPAQLSSAGTDAPEEALRASAFDARTLLVRFGSRVPVGVAPLLQTRTGFDASVIRANACLARQWESAESYRIASHGSLLPYDPTAPPYPG